MSRLHLLAFLVFIFIAGCETNTLGVIADDSGKDSDIQEARLALDDANYDKAINLLLDYYDPASPDPEVAGYLSSAYMGKAGSDLSYVFQNLGAEGYRPGEVIASALTRNIIALGAPSSSQLPGTKAFSEEESAWFISVDSIERILENLENAQSVLTSFIDANVGQETIYDDDAAVKLGIASALHFMVKTGYIVSQVTHLNIPLNRYAYMEVFPEDSDWMTLLEETSLNIDGKAEDLTYLRTDLRYVLDSAQTLAEIMGVDKGIVKELSGFNGDLMGISNSADVAAIRSAINTYTGEDFARFVRAVLLAYE